MLYPLKFSPIYKENIWGGNSLKMVYKRHIPSDHTGESWDIACHPHGMSVVSNGSLKGTSLETILKSYKDELLGPIGTEYDKFPLLVKIIDAKDRLSLQVHPDDLYAYLLEQGEYGKCEMWYILKAKEDSKIIIGLKEGVTKSDFIKGIISGNLEECVNQVPVKEGDVINIPAGLIHAIAEDIMIAEVQQNSDTVYRVFDWNRKDLDGKPRTLHIEKALGSIDFGSITKKSQVTGLKITTEQMEKAYYIGNEHFAIEKLKVYHNLEEDTEGRKMYIYICVSGAFEIVWQDTITVVNLGESVLIPAALGKMQIVGSCEILKAYIPNVTKDIIEPLKAYGYSNDEIESKVSFE